MVAAQDSELLGRMGRYVVEMEERGGGLGGEADDTVARKEPADKGGAAAGMVGE